MFAFSARKLLTDLADRNDLRAPCADLAAKLAAGDAEGVRTLLRWFARIAPEAGRVESTGVPENDWLGGPQGVRPLSKVDAPEHRERQKPDYHGLPVRDIRHHGKIERGSLFDPG